MEDLATWLQGPGVKNQVFISDNHGFDWMFGMLVLTRPQGDAYTPPGG